ncbi:hypothetical protein ACRRTK_014535 [Alexandromys fortis]
MDRLGAVWELCVAFYPHPESQAKMAQEAPEIFAEPQPSLRVLEKCCPYGGHTPCHLKGNECRRRPTVGVRHFVSET